MVAGVPKRSAKRPKVAPEAEPTELPAAVTSTSGTKKRTKKKTKKGVVDLEVSAGGDSEMTPKNAKKRAKAPSQHTPTADGVAASAADTARPRKKRKSSGDGAPPSMAAIAAALARDGALLGPRAKKKAKPQKAGEASHEAVNSASDGAPTSNGVGEDKGAEVSDPPEKKATDNSAIQRMMEAMPWDPAVKRQISMNLTGQADTKVVRVGYRRRTAPTEDAAAANGEAALRKLATPSLSGRDTRRAAPPKIRHDIDLNQPKPQLSSGEEKREKWLKRKARKVFLGGCPEDITETHVLEHYQAELGPDCVEKIHFGKEGKGEWERFLGYTLVKFKTQELAEQAAQMRPPVVSGRRLRVEYGMLGHLMAKNTYKAADKGGRSWNKLLFEGERALPDAGWTLAKMEAAPFRKNFGDHVHRVTRSAAEIAQFATHAQAEIEGGLVKPIYSFDEVDFGEGVNLKLKEDFKEPMAIQGHCWPVVLGGRDCIGLAETGSGKTLSFLLPARTHLESQVLARRDSGGDVGGPVVLVLVPSRELAVQISKEFKQFRCGLDYHVSSVYGGESVERQKRYMKCDVLVATPARLAHLVDLKYVDLSRVTYLVLDEADHMLHLGLALQVAGICGQIRPDRQTVMFSATWMKEVRKLAKEVLRFPVKVMINGVSTGLANTHIKQEVVFVKGANVKLDTLVGVVKSIKEGGHPITRMMVFVDKRAALPSVVSRLKQKHPDTLAYSSDLSQQDRQRNLEHLRKNPHAILVCTNAAARGLDIKDVTFVINYDLPQTIERYVHRIGRTGRAGQTGVAYSLYNPNTDWRIVRQLIRCIGQAKQEVPALLYQYAQQDWGAHALHKGSGRDDTAPTEQDSEDDA